MVRGKVIEYAQIHKTISRNRFASFNSPLKYHLMKALLLIFAYILTLPIFSTGQTTPTPYLSTENWLKDATTIQFSSPTSRNSLNGLRFIFEPQLGVLIQESDNRVIVENLTTLSKIGFETNLYKNIISFQILFISPSKVQLDEDSPLRKEGQTKDIEGKLNVDFGISAGLSFIDGILSIGFGGIFYDKRGFVSSITGDRGEYQNNFIYINIQPISAIKSLIKKIKE